MSLECKCPLNGDVPKAGPAIGNFAHLVPHSSIQPSFESLSQRVSRFKGLFSFAFR